MQNQHNPKENWFEMAKAYPLQEYLERIYMMDFSKNKKAICPFHDDTKPTLSIKNDLYKCFACDASGDITRFVEKKEGLTALEAVKKVLADNGVEVEKVRNLTPQEQEAHNRIVAETNKKRLEKQQKEVEQLKVNREFAIRNMNLIANKYRNDLDIAIKEGHTQVIDTIEKIFPKYFMVDNFLDAIGWDWDNETVVIFTKDLNGNVLNIKRRTLTKNFSNWDVTSHLYTWRGDGKWIGWKDSTTYPFGLLFPQNDDRVIITEGEKDAFNLIGLGINALTLGGVTSKWEQYSNLLKNKRVYIWFDNDKAGYLNAIKRFEEIKDIAKSCQIVLFSKLEREFEEKGDVSDYLQLYKIDNKEEVFNRIAYSSFAIHNELLKEIDDLYDNWKNERPTDWLKKIKQVEFKDIREDILKNANSVRGEKDNQLKALQLLGETLNNSNNKKNVELMLKNLFNDQPDAIAKEIETIKKLVSLKKTIMNDYRQVHIRDITMEAMRTFKTSGYMFAKYRGSMYLWTGAYYYKFKVYSKEDSEITDFLLQRLFRAIKLDYKKQTVETAQKVAQNIKGYSQSLEEWIDKKKRILTMQNGALVINSNGKYLFKNEANKKDCAFNILDIHYKAEATAPKWQKFLDRVLPDKLDQNALMEFIGYCLMPSHEFEKFLLLYGESGANGKSVVLDVIKSFFGKENISGVQLQNFTGHELDGLTGKILNIGSELDSKTDLKEQISALKNLVSTNDTITINPKFEKGYEMDAEEKPKMAFASNGIPKLGVDGGFFRRALVLNFNQEILDNEKIRNLVSRFEDEKAGILNMALQGLTRLIKQNSFSMSETRANFMEQYRDDADPIRVYVKESLKTQKGVMVAKNYIYEHYKTWCEDRGHRVSASRTFFAKLKSHIKEYSEKRTTIGSDPLLPSNCWYVEDIAFRKNAIDEFHFKKGMRKTKDCMIDAKGGFQVIFE